MAKDIQVPERIAKDAELSGDTKIFLGFISKNCKPFEMLASDIGSVTAKLGVSQQALIDAARQATAHGLLPATGCAPSMAISFKVRARYEIEYFRKGDPDSPQQEIDFEPGDIPPIAKSRITEGEDWAATELTRYTAKVTRVFASDESEDVLHWLLNIEAKDIVGDSSAHPVRDAEYPTDVDAFAAWDDFLLGVTGEIVSRAYAEESERDRQTRERFEGLEPHPGVGAVEDFDVIAWVLAFAVDGETDVLLMPLAFESFVAAVLASDPDARDTQGECEEALRLGRMTYDHANVIWSEDGHSLPSPEPVASEEDTEARLATIELDLMTEDEEPVPYHVSIAWGDKECAIVSITGEGLSESGHPFNETLSKRKHGGDPEAWAVRKSNQMRGILLKSRVKGANGG